MDAAALAQVVRMVADAVDAAAVAADQRNNRCSHHGSGLYFEPSITNDQTNRTLAGAISTQPTP
jgi:hypothetical protein